MDPSISIIIPCYNSAGTLHRALASIRSQKYEDYEVIVTDDGSSDNPAQVIAEFGDQRIRYTLLPHRGVSAARNAGVVAARGNFIAFLDSDDEWLPGKLHAQLAAFRADDCLGLVAARAQYITVDGKVFQGSEKTHRGHILGALAAGNFIVTSSVMVRRDLLRKIREPFDERLSIGEDWLLWLRIAARTSCAVLPQIFVRYHGWRPGKFSADRWLTTATTVAELSQADDFMRRDRRVIRTLLGQVAIARFDRERVRKNYGLMLKALGRAIAVAPYPLMRRLIRRTLSISTSFSGKRPVS